MNANKSCNTTNRRWLRKIGIATLAVLFIGVCLFSQSQNSNKGQKLGLGKLEPILESLSNSSIDQEVSTGVIVQFLDDEEIIGSGMTKQEVKKAAKAARIRALADAGALMDRDFDNLPIHTAHLTFGALKRLERHPYVKRISLNHTINGSTYTTARAIGADQVWAGSWYVQSYTGSGIGVAVLDSGVDTRGDMTNQIAFSTSMAGSTADEYGHGTHVAATIVGNGSL